DGAAVVEGVTGHKAGPDREAWTAWFVRRHPELSARLTNVDGVDVAGWAKRLARVDWTQGDVSRGQLVYTKASCATCHSGAQALGPDLRGVTGRFSRADLFTAILQPSRDVSPRYQTTVIETAEGRVYQGVVIYGAGDGLLLQSGPATPVRLAGDRVVSRRVSPLSLMPAGLLDNVSDRALADRDASLRSLAAPPKN